MGLFDSLGRPVIIDIETAYTQAGVQAAGVSTLGNTAGNTGTVTGSVVFAGSNNITLSQATAAGAATVWVQLTGGGAGGDGYNIIAAGAQTANTTGTVVLSNSNNVSFGMSNSSVVTASASFAQSVQSAIKAFGASNTGNTSGNTGVSTGIDWVVAGTNNITISESTAGGGPNTIWVSGPTVGGAQTGISGVGVSDTTYTSGTVILSGQANITVGSSVDGASQYVRLSVAAAPAQTNVALSASNASSTFQTATFGNSNGLSFYYTNGSIVGSYTVPTQTVQPVALSGSNGSFNFSTATFGNSNGLTFYTTNGSMVGSYTVPTQTAQTLGVYGSSQTTGSASSGTHDARSVSIIGAGIISVGNHSTSAGGTTTGIIISATQSNQAFSADASSTFQTLSFQNSNLVSFSNNAGAIRITHDLMASSSRPAFSADASSTFQTLTFQNSNGVSFSNNAGALRVTHDLQFTSNTSNITSNALHTSASKVAGIVAATNNAGGGTATLTGNVLFSSANGLTFYTSAGNAIVGSYTVPSVPAQTNQTGNVYAGSNTFGTSSGTYDARTLSLIGVGAVSIAASDSGWRISAPAQTAQTVGLYASSQTTGQSSSSTVDARSLTFRGAGNVSVGLSGGEVLISATGAGGGGVSSLNASQGELTLVAGNLVSISNNASTISAINLLSSATVVSSVASVNVVGAMASRFALEGHQHAGVVAIGVSNTGTTLGDTRTLHGIAVLAASGNVTASQSTGIGQDTVWISVPAQSLQSAARGIGVSNTGNTIGDTGVVTAKDIVIAASGAITASQSTAAGSNTIWLSVAAQTIQTQNMVSIQGSTGAITFSNSNNVSFGFNASTITATATFAQTAQSAIKALGVSNTGTTAGNTGVSTGVDWVIAASGNITASQSTAGGGPNTVWLSVPAQTTNGVQQLDGSAGTLTLVAGNLISVSNNASTISIINILSSSAIAQPVSSASGAGTLSSRFALADHAHAGVAAFAVSNTGTTAGNTGTRVGTLVVAASGNVTASQSTGAAGIDTIWLSVPSQTNQSAIKAFGVSNTGTTAGNTGVSTGIDWVVAASGNITASQSTAGGGPNTVWLSVPAQTAETAISGIGASNTTYTSGTVIFSAQSNITIGTSLNGASQYVRFSVADPSAAAITQTVGLSNITAGGATGGTSGGVTGDDIQYIFVPGTNVTMSQSINGSSGTLSIYAGGGGGAVALGVSNTGHTAGNTGTYSSATIVFAGSSSLTLSQSTGAGSVHTIWLQPAMSQLAAGNLISLSSNGSTISVINLLSSSATALDVASASAAGTLSSRFALADHAHAGVAAWGVSNTGNTAGNSGTKQGTWVLAGSNSITISGSTGGAGVHTLWVQQTGGAGGGVALGVSNTGNTAGNTGTYSSGTMVIAGSNSLTLSQSTGGAGVHTIWLQPLASALSGGGGISLSTTGSTIVIYTV